LDVVVVLIVIVIFVVITVVSAAAILFVFFSINIISISTGPFWIGGGAAGGVTAIFVVVMRRAWAAAPRWLAFFIGQVSRCWIEAPIVRLVVVVSILVRRHCGFRGTRVVASKMERWGRAGRGKRQGQGRKRKAGDGMQTDLFWIPAFDIELGVKGARTNMVSCGG